MDESGADEFERSLILAIKQKGDYILQENINGKPAYVICQWTDGCGTLIRVRSNNSSGYLTILPEVFLRLVSSGKVGKVSGLNIPKYTTLWVIISG